MEVACTPQLVGELREWSLLTSKTCPGRGLGERTVSGENH